MADLQVRLDLFNNDWYRPGRNIFIRLAWYFINLIFFRSGWLIFSFPKRILLQLFGASVGKGVVIKPHVNIKYPWKLHIGNYVWIGEEVWIDNLDQVQIGDHVCISQGALLICGNHNYKHPDFGLITKPIIIETGAWIGAMCRIGPGSIIQKNSVFSLGAVFTGTSQPGMIYQGNPAQPIRKRNN
jgi:putative colanic acid biosynthesis acetyltransferase WcaF